MCPHKKKKNLGWMHSLVPSLPSRSQTLAISVKIYVKIDTKIFFSCPVLLDLSILFQMFCQGLQTNWNIQNSVMLFTFPVLAGNTIFGQIWSKNQNCQFNLEFGTQTNSNMKNSIVMLIVSAFDRKYPFLRNLFQICSS